MLVVMLDPTGSVTHMKDKVFGLFMLWNLLTLRPDLRMMPHVLAVFLVITISYLMGEVQGTITNYDEVAAAYKSLAPIIMLPWVHHYNLMNKTMLPSLIICLITIVCWTLMQSSPLAEKAIYTFMTNHDMMVSISYRQILGYEIFGFYYKSFVAMLFAMFLCIYGMLHTDRILKRIAYILAVALFLVTCALSGTRSTMLLPVAMLVMCTWRWMLAKQWLKYLLLPVLSLVCVAFVVMIVVLATEGGELSNHIKFLHVTSYIDLFAQHPEYLLWGQGPGTTFYTEGFRAFAVRTEWSYLDMLRNYGLLSLVMIAVFAWPLRMLWHRVRGNDFVFGIWSTYLIYLIIAGTNPLLLSSTGMVMILSAYSFACKYDNR